MEISTTTGLQSSGASDNARRKKPAQPLSVIDVPDALLTLATVAAVTGESASSLYRAEKRGELTPVRRGQRCTRWRAGDVMVYLRARSASPIATA